MILAIFRHMKINVPKGAKMINEFNIDEYINKYRSQIVGEESVSLVDYEKDLLIKFNSVSDRNCVLKVVRARLASDRNVKNLVYYCGIINVFKDKNAVPLIFRMLKDDYTKGWRSSLVYAVTDLNPLEYFEDLVDLVISGDREVVMYALVTINDLDGDVEREAVVRSYHKVYRALKKTQPKWRREELEALATNF